MTIDWAQRLHDARHLPPAALLGCTAGCTADEVQRAWETLDLEIRQTRSELEQADTRHRQFEEIAQAADDARDILLAAVRAQ